MAIVKILQEHGVPMFTTSPQSYAKQLETSLNELEAKHGKILGFQEVTVGRSRYGLVVLDAAPEAPVVEPVAVVEPAPEVLPEPEAETPVEEAPASPRRKAK